jgi:ABC-2 type transport system ATP-binding protein
MSDVSPAIEVRGLHKTFGDVRAIDGLDLSVAPGEVRGLVGPNGAGKTTLLRIVFGLVSRTDGNVRVLDQDPDASSTSTIVGVGGFVEEPRFYPYLSARRNLELMASLDGAGHDRIDEVLATVRLVDRASRKVGGFSSGMRQRLGLAASLLRRPRLLVLDEPTVGLDPTGTRDVLEIVRSLATDGVTVLLSSHDMAQLEGVCDSITVMHEGRSVWDGSMERLRAESPAPAHRLDTSDDARAIELAAGMPSVEIVADTGRSLMVSAAPDVLDAYVVALGREGVAVRRLELVMTALESMYFALTGERPAARSDDPREAIGAAP